MERNKTLEQLENDYWEEIDYPTKLVQKCYELRKKKLNDLSIDEVRLLISQNIGLVVLVPLALNFLKVNILAEGNLYPGDLLESVISRDCKYWQRNRNQLIEIKSVLLSNLDDIKQSELIDDEIKNNLLGLYEKLSGCV